MKNIILGLSLVLCAGYISGQGLEKVIVEKYYISDARDAAAFGGQLLVGSVTYRIFVDMLPGYRFQAAYGIPGHELRLATTTLFFNNEDKGGIVSSVIPYRNLKDNTVMLDSWLSAGGAAEGSFGILKTMDDGVETIVNEKGILQNSDPGAGIPIKVQDGLIAGMPPKVTSFGIDSIVDVFKNRTIGSEFSTTNGSWATMNGAIGPDSIDNKVLIAQITTNGVFTFELNIQIGKPAGGVENYVAKNPVAKEIQLSSLAYPETALTGKKDSKDTGRNENNK